MRVGGLIPGKKDLASRTRFAVARETRASTFTLLLAIPVVVLLFALPAFASRVLLQELFYVFTMLALAQLWNLLAGSAGLISVGQQAFVGMGAYALFAFTAVAGLNAVPAIVLAGIIAGLVAIPAALIVFRLRGAYFAIGTWVVAEVCRLVLAQVKQLGGGTGTSLPPDIASSIFGLDFVRNLFAVRGPAARDMMTYWLALVLAIGTFILVYRLLRSRYGLALSAIGNSEAAAESTGVDVFRTKFLIYVLTAVATGMVGALIFLQKARISPDASVLADRLDRLCHLHCRDRRHRHHGGTDHRRRDLLPVAILPGRARLLVPDPARRPCHSAHAVCAVRRLGRDRAFARHQSVSGTTTLGRHHRQHRHQERKQAVARHHRDFPGSDCVWRSRYDAATPRRYCSLVRNSIYPLGYCDAATP